VDVREKIAISLLCLALGGCATVHDYVYGPPTHFIVFFSGKGTVLSSDGRAIVKSAAARITTSRPTSVVIESGVDAGGDLAEPRFTAVRQALIDDGVAQDLIARSDIPGPKLAGNSNSTGDQRVEIRLLAKAP
jgi:hypothetical protein